VSNLKILKLIILGEFFNWLIRVVISNFQFVSTFRPLITLPWSFLNPATIPLWDHK